MTSTKITRPNGTIEYRVNNLWHNDVGPAIEYPNGDKLWYQNGILHREDGPAIDRFGGIKEWYKNGVQHRIEYPNGDKSWYQNGILHREDGPAIERFGGIKEWYKNGVQHREDGPAIEYPDGRKVWVIGGVRHRIGEPAFIGPEGKSWWNNGLRHREDGPAHIRTDGLIEWWVDGIKYTEEEFNKKMNIKYEQVAGHTKSVSTVNSHGTISWKLPDGTMHREGGPAIERLDGNNEWFINGMRHRVDGPAYTYYNGDTIWYFNNKFHREDGPAYEGVAGKSWWVHGKRHRTNGPARMLFNPDGTANNEWWIDGVQMTEAEFNKKMIITMTDDNGDKHWLLGELHHRDDGPAFEGANGSKSWWKNGKRHRLDGPARISSKGVKQWYIDGKEFLTESEFTKEVLKLAILEGENKMPKIKNGKVVAPSGETWYKDNLVHRDDGPAIIALADGKYWYKNGVQHREGGPAVERDNGEKIWMINGKHHRIDGPALEHNGIKQWWIDGNNISEEHFIILTTKSNEKKEDINVGNEVTFMDRVKADAAEAGYRVAATQFTSAIKQGILLLFKDKGFDDSKLSVVKEMLESEFGTAMVSVVLGYGLNYVPKLKDDPRILKLAKEFRVNGMAVAGNEIMGIGLQYMMPALSKAMESLPPIKEVMPEALRKKPGKKRVHTGSPQTVPQLPVTEEKTATSAV